MRRHRWDPVALLLGLLTLACAGAWLAWDRDALTAAQLVVAGPVTLIVLGLVGVLVSMLRGSSSEAPMPTPDDPDHPDYPDHPDKETT